MSPSHSSSQSKHKSIIEDSSSFRLYEKRILSNHSVFLFVLKPGSDGFAPGCIKVLHGLGSMSSYLHSVPSSCCSSSSVMIQI